MTGPLQGTRIVELAGIGPAPFAAMMLADMGADVVRIERAQAVRRPLPTSPHADTMLRGRRNVALDLKSEAGRSAVLRLLTGADALIEGFRPGVLERLGLAPQTCWEHNPRLVVGRMTGWGQTGPYANAAGHDINYIALAGALAHFARQGQAPVPPMNTVGDFGGGGMLLAFGVVCGVLEAQRSGRGQVIDAAMIDGTAALMSMFWAVRASGAFDEDHPGTNLLDTGAHFYDVYCCADGRYVSVGPIEPQFYVEFLQRLGLHDDPAFAEQMRRDRWPELKARLADVFGAKTRDEWCALLEHTDVCFAPVLTMTEAARHPHHVERGTFVELDGRLQPAPAPRFSRTPGAVRRPPAHPGQHTSEVLAECGFADHEIAGLIDCGAAAQA